MNALRYIFRISAKEIVDSRFWPAFSLVLKFLSIYWHVSVFSRSSTYLLTPCGFIPDLSFVSRGKEKNDAENYLPLIFADEYSKHTLSDAPLVSVPKKKLKGNYNRECHDFTQRAT